MTINQLLKITLTGAALSISVACTTHDNKTDNLAIETRAHIERAAELGGEQYAPLAIRSARQHLTQATAAIEKSDYEEAERLLEKAKLDATYAIALSNSKKTQDAARQIEANLEALRNKI